MSITKYVKAVNSGVGFITHDDQELIGLKFEIVLEKDGESYVKVIGDEASIDAWVVRVLGVEVDEPILPPTPPSVEERISAVEEVLLMII